MEDQAAYSCNLGVLDDSGRQDKGRMPLAGQPALGLESRTQSRRAPQLAPVGRCNWL